jgi:hypothetical protein
VVRFKTLGSENVVQQNPIDIGPFGITCEQEKSHPRYLYGDCRNQYFAVVTEQIDTCSVISNRSSHALDPN